ncbi:hypothetical protein [Streptomyces corynorhini]|uniref:Uncharacterized protein n=1 Tax=Streptomyces corynorhini TaxID=2282652 RepID=A0A370B6Q3_9ACTN|nr:hypothetical protein [Streptomyces corynorhini]RDG37507.1 hypothetical protein DVH02_14155 [Streptomyces corynorhini]
MRDRIRAAAVLAAPTPPTGRCPSGLDFESCRCVDGQTGARCPQGSTRRTIANGWVRRSTPTPTYAAQVINTLADQLAQTHAEPVTIDVQTTAFLDAGRTVLATVPPIVQTAVLDRVIATLPAPRTDQGETCGEWAIRLRSAAVTR